MKYTIKDVIIDPEDPRIVIGDEYYFGDSPCTCINTANRGGEGDILTTTDPSLLNPFFTSHATWQCAIHKKEPETKLVPFDLNNPKDRMILMDCHVKRVNHPESEVGYEEGVIIGFRHGDQWRAMINGSPVEAKWLLENWAFIDGRPCGKEVTE